MRKKLLSLLLIVSFLLSSMPMSGMTAQAGTSIALPIFVSFDSFKSNAFSDTLSDNKMFYASKKSGTGYDANVVSNQYLRLTDNNNDRATSVVRKSPISLKNGFSTYFQVDMHDLKSSPADGICFMIYDASLGYQVGAAGSGLGYGDIDYEGVAIKGDSMAVELDTYWNGTGEHRNNNGSYNSSTSQFHVAIDANDFSGTGIGSKSGKSCTYTNVANVVHDDTSKTEPSTDYTSPTNDGTKSVAHYYSDLYDGTAGGSSSNYISVWVDMVPISGDSDHALVTVTYGKNTDRGSSSNYSFKRSVSSTLLNKDVYVGFSASTGGSAEYHDVRAWEFNNAPIEGGLDPVNGTYTQAAAAIDINTQKTDGTLTTTDPEESIIKVLDPAGNVMASQDVKVSLDGGTADAKTTDEDGELAYDLSNISPGSHKISVVTADGSAQNSATFIVMAKAAVSLAVDPSTNSQTVGTSVILNAVLTGAKENDNQTIDFYNETTKLGSATTDAEGKATYEYTPNVGNYNYKAQYSGATYSNAAISSTISYTITKATPTMKLSVEPASGTTRPITDNKVTLTISDLPSDATGTIQFQQGGDNIGSPVSVVYGSAQIDYSIDDSLTYDFSAEYSGNSKYKSTTEAIDNYSLSKANQSIIVNSHNNVTYGVGSFTATASGGMGTGEYVWSITNPSVEGIATIDQTGKVMVNGAGSFTISVYHAGDDDYNASLSKTIHVTVNKAILNVVPNSQQKVFGNADPELTFQYTGNVDGEIPNFTGTLGRESGENVGNYAIDLGSLALANNDGFKASNYNLVLGSNLVKLNIVRHEHSTLKLDVETTKYFGDNPFKAVASGGNGTGNYVWSIINEYDSSGNTSTGKIASVDQEGIITILGAGKFTITVYREGDKNYQDSKSVFTDITVQKKAAQIDGSDSENGTDNSALITKAQIEDNNISSVKVKIGNVTIEGNSSILDDILGNDISAHLKLTQKASSEKLQKEVEAIVAKNGDLTVLALDLDLVKIFSDGKTEAIHQLKDYLSVTVKLSAEQLTKIINAKKVELYYYNNNILEKVDAVFDIEAGTVTFKINHFSTWVISIDKKVVNDNNENTKHDLPKTGDNSQPIWYVVGCAICFVSLLFVNRKNILKMLLRDYSR